MYDSLLSFKSDDLIPRALDVQMFLRGARGHKYNPLKAQWFGWRVMDFRYPTWPCQVNEEKERQEVLCRELEVMRRGFVVDAERAPDEYVRMPLVVGGSWRWQADGRKSLLYPATENVGGRGYRV